MKEAAMMSISFSSKSDIVPVLISHGGKRDVHARDVDPLVALDEPGILNFDDNPLFSLLDDVGDEVAIVDENAHADVERIDDNGRGDLHLALIAEAFLFDERRRCFVLTEN